MRLRQIAFVAKDLKATTDELCSVLGLDVAYRDPGVGKWGLENIVAPIGGDFLEIVAPKEDHTSAGRYLDRRKGDGGYMVILQVSDALAYRKRLHDMGIRAVATRDQRDYTYTHFHPADVGGFLLSIDSGAPEDDWKQKALSLGAGGTGLEIACARGWRAGVESGRIAKRRSGGVGGTVGQAARPAW